MNSLFNRNQGSALSCSTSGAFVSRTCGFDKSGLSCKKAQVTLTFNWVFVLIAGAIILLFFVGIVVRQRQVSDQQLNRDVVQILDTILTGASVSENTKNVIDTSALRDRALSFTCELPLGSGYSSIFSSYGIEESSATIETPIEAIFSPSRLSGTQLVSWSVPFEFPFKVSDLLLVTSNSVKYVVTGTANPQFRQQLVNTSDGLTIEFIDSLEELNLGRESEIRIIHLGGQGALELRDGAQLNSQLSRFDDSAFSAVLFTANSVRYFGKRGSRVVAKEERGALQLLSLTGNADAVRLAAMLSYNQEQFECSMLKVFRRMKILVEMYRLRAQELEQFYSVQSSSFDSACQTILNGDSFDDTVFDTLDSLAPALSSCLIAGYPQCQRIQGLADRLDSLNRQLEREDCITLY